MTAESDELGITEADRKKLAEIAADRRKQGNASRVGNFGVESDAVSIALDRCPDLPPARTLAVAWLFENGSATATEAVEATSVSYPTVKETFDGLVDSGLAHTDSQREFPGKGRNPTVYVPCPDGPPGHL